MEAAMSTSSTFVIGSLSQMLHAIRFESCCLVFFAAWCLLYRGALSWASSPPKVKVAALRPGTGKASRPGADHGPPGLQNPIASELRDEVWVEKAVAHLSISKVYADVQRAVDLFKRATRAGVDISRLPAHRGEQFFMNLVTAALRVNQPRQALEMLEVCRKSGFIIGQDLLASAVKLCTSKQYYTECLAIYDFASQDKALQIGERSVWSCLLFCSVECHALQRCTVFWKKIQECGNPTIKDYGNLIRFASKQGDWQVTLSAVNEMRENGMKLDSVIHNTALSSCVSANRFDEARELLQEMESSEGVVDVITYNTLAKGYATNGRLEDCFDILEHMRTHGFAFSQVSYGILLECCIMENHLDRALEVFRDMVKDGCVMNTVLYTTIMKGFARAKKVDQAMEIYKSMLEDSTEGVAPDLITFSILIKAHCVTGRVTGAVDLLEKMTEFNLAPDEVIFNDLLNCCTQHSDADLARRLFDNMIEVGVRPSMATLSAMIRAYASCKLMSEALEMLRTAPQRAGVDAEPRLFLQLCQACLLERQGRMATKTYQLLLDRASPTPDITGILLAKCSKLNMFATGVELLQLASRACAHVAAKDVAEFRLQAIKKKKAQFVEQIDECSVCTRVRSAADALRVERCLRFLHSATRPSPPRSPHRSSPVDRLAAAGAHRKERF